MPGENIQKGTSWLANLSRLSFDFSKSHIMALKEQGVPLLDDEINFLQEAQLALLRQAMRTVVGDGSPDNGFKIVGTGAANDFTIKAGNILVDGWVVKLAADTSYSAQPVAQAGLTTPGGARTDLAYLDIWLDEIDQAEDVTIVDPTLGTRTSTRLKLFWAVKVAEGVSVPASGMDGNNLYHWRYQIASLARTAVAAIGAGIVTDSRVVFATLGTVNYSASDALTKIKTVDGAASGLDADLLDGHHASDFVTPASFTTGLTANGHLEMPGGLIFQWGGEAANHDPGGGQIVAMTFPIAFPHACFMVHPSLNGSNCQQAVVNALNPTTTGFSFVFDEMAGVVQNCRGVYFAIGW